MKAVQALVMTGFGLNCDLESAHALELAGAQVRRVHINALIDGAVRLEDFQILVFGGGFSWGDDHGAGVLQAVRLQTHIGDAMLRFIEDGKLVIGICNGFQALVNLGLLPGLDGDYGSRKVALVSNDCGNFRDQWVHLAVNAASPCVFTGGLDGLELPVRHGEGKFYAETSLLERLNRENLVVLRYVRPDEHPAHGAFPHNPNGALEDVAGICDPSGRVFGLMPHPEAYNHFTNHPDWTLKREQGRRQGQLPDSGPTPGIRIFRNAVAYLTQSR